ncbi:hypothetical protein FRC19_004234 [Serendipita sp. 401]|nr:hypothetical protein FRC19_004234 [Serendipita sp. 401]
MDSGQERKRSFDTAFVVDECHRLSKRVHLDPKDIKEDASLDGSTVTPSTAVADTDDNSTTLDITSMGTKTEVKGLISNTGSNTSREDVASQAPNPKETPLKASSPQGKPDFEKPLPVQSVAEHVNYDSVSSSIIVFGGIKTEPHLPETAADTKEISSHQAADSQPVACPLLQANSLDINKSANASSTKENVFSGVILSSPPSDSAKSHDTRPFVHEQGVSPRSILSTHGHINISTPRPKVSKSLASYQASTNLVMSSPTHPNVASQGRSQEKIHKPFRSPLLSKSREQNNMSSSDGHRTLDLGSKHRGTPVSADEMPKKRQVNRIKGSGTDAARAAFKSPLRVNQPSAPTRRVTPGSEIYALEQRAQLLRRAVEIKKSGEDEHLEELATKWRNVAKEIAWELWEIVKEGNTIGGHEINNFAGSVDGAMGSSGFKDDDAYSSGGKWSDSGNKTEDEGTEIGDDWEDEPRDDGPHADERNMGSMLKQLGIANETLGWNEDEGDFTS